MNIRILIRLTSRNRRLPVTEVEISWAERVFSEQFIARIALLIQLDVQLPHHRQQFFFAPFERTDDGNRKNLLITHGFVAGFAFLRGFFRSPLILSVPTVCRRMMFVDPEAPIVPEITPITSPFFTTPRCASISSAPRTISSAVGSMSHMIG